MPLQNCIEHLNYMVTWQHGSLAVIHDIFFKNRATWTEVCSLFIHFQSEESELRTHGQGQGPCSLKGSCPLMLI